MFVVVQKIRKALLELGLKHGHFTDFVADLLPDALQGNKSVLQVLKPLSIFFLATPRMAKRGGGLLQLTSEGTGEFLQASLTTSPLFENPLALIQQADDRMDGVHVPSHLQTVQKLSDQVHKNLVPGFPGQGTKQTLDAFFHAQFLLPVTVLRSRVGTFEEAFHRMFIHQVFER